ncbi:STAS domain-containing protein [Indiicoccus explosivorum]|uniref:STAS domain-containing protein n=1 Tax=Indiicoccus explosivorum TaxID=1917864 RepID=UPI000B4551CF|nr:STAS domain-containing protein [Indiicoccus explosivorum]
MTNTARDAAQLKVLFLENREAFEKRLLSEAVNVRDKINEILTIGNIDLVNNAHRLVGYIIDGKDQELEAFARQEGIAWATHSIDLTFKLEWIQAIRRTLWIFIEQFSETIEPQSSANFFRLEQQINNHVDSFLNAFFLSYSTYKDQLITSHRKLVENLSVPLIPINASICVLPLIGTVDSFRSSIIEEKVLTEIGAARIQTLIMDFSGIADIESDVAAQLTKIIDGTHMMGCRTVITGLRADVVQKMLRLGLTFDNKTKTLGTLQQALKEYFTEQ